MKKIPTLFVKDKGKRFCLPKYKVELEPGSLALRKFDGTAMYLDRQGQWHYRRSYTGVTPKNFVSCTVDKYSGRTFGWLPVDNDYSYRKQFNEALAQDPYDTFLSPDCREPVYEFGTYELIGEKINGNAEHVCGHRLMPHKRAPQISNISVLEIERLLPYDAYHALKKELETLPIEGVVFWSPYIFTNEDGEDETLYKPVAKLRKKDFDY